MSTKRSLIQQALGEIGLGVYIFDATAEQLQDALTRMNRMAARWDATGLRFGYNMGGGLDDESGLPDTSEDCYALNLALNIAPSYGKTPSQDTRINAKMALNALLITDYVIPQVPFDSRMPIGRGNQLETKDRQYFTPDDPITTGQDGELEF